MKKSDNDLQESERLLTDLIKKAIGSPEATQSETIGSIRDAVVAL